MPCSRLTIAVRSSRFFIESIFYVSYFQTGNVEYSTHAVGAGIRAALAGGLEATQAIC
jgi:hypothetical protein